MRDVWSFVSFNEGHRYPNFVPGKDKVATYGIGPLIGGRWRPNAGPFKGLIAVILTGKRFLIAGVVAASAGIRKFPEQNNSVAPTTNA
jgi:uncharacterized membrane-anchored protein